MKVFIAGAGGAIGQHLVPLLTERGHQVTAATRSSRKLEPLRELGAQPVLMDGLDRDSVEAAIGAAGPEVVIHQMTALSGSASMRRFDRTFALTNQLRTTGTDHLLAAAVAAGTRRFVCQSYTGWTNIREGSLVKSEDDPLDPRPPRAQRQTLAAIRYLEGAVLAAPLEGIVLRYGTFYGPGASDELIGLVRGRKLPVVGTGSGVWSFLHIADAAAATAAAVDRGAPGVYNLADDEPVSVSRWLPYLARSVGAKPPLQVPAWVGLLGAGEVGVSMMTRVRGSANAKAKQELNWTPAWPSWRDGFRHGLTEPWPAGRLA